MNAQDKKELDGSIFANLIGFVAAAIAIIIIVYMPESKRVPLSSGFRYEMFPRCGTIQTDTATYYMDGAMIDVVSDYGVRDTRIGCPVGVQHHDEYKAFNPIYNHSEIKRDQWN